MKNITDQIAAQSAAIKRSKNGPDTGVCLLLNRIPFRFQPSLKGKELAQALGHAYGPADTAMAQINAFPAFAKALLELVKTKRMKDKKGKTPAYQKRRDAAWAEAEKVLAECHLI